MELTYSKIRQAVEKMGYKWSNEPLYPNLVGIRSTIQAGNLYNDIMCVCWRNKDGVEEKPFFYSQTTLPGKFWLNNPTLAAGCAILVPGQYFAWTKGIHGKTRPHDALVQFAGPVTIIRDGNKNDIAEWEGVKPIPNQYIGLNIHASWAKGERKFIDKDSAACQVSGNEYHHEKMMAIVDEYIKHKLGLGYLPATSELITNKKLWVTFGYTLLREKELLAVA